jgi:hypothetical protein
MALIATVPICFGQTTAKSSAKETAVIAVIDLEKATWETYKNKQADAFKKYFAKEYNGVYAEGIKSLDTEVADMAKTDLRSYSFADTNVTFPSAGVAVITYKVTGQGTFDGKDMSGTYNAASVYVQREGKWLGVFHTEVKAQQP